MSLALRIHPNDNVVTMLTDSPAGRVSILGNGAQETVEIIEFVAAGHKAALAPIACGSGVLKFGVPIGTATADIPAGGWVHTHNCASCFDARSSTLDRHTGAPTDTKYE